MAMVLQTRRFKQIKRLVIKEHPISEIQCRKAVEGHIHIAHTVVGVVRKEGEAEMGQRIEVVAGFVRIHDADVLGLEHGAQIAAGGGAEDLADVAGVGFGCRQGVHAVPAADFILEAPVQGLQQDQAWPEGIGLQPVNAMSFIQPAFPKR